MVMETLSDQIIHGMVAARRGVAIVPYPLSGAPYNTQILPIANDIPQRKLYLQWNKSGISLRQQSISVITSSAAERCSTNTWNTMA